MRTVLLTEPIHESGRALLAAASDIEIVDGHRLNDAELAAALGRAEAILVRVRRLDRGVLDLAPRLRVVAKHGVGVDNIDVDHCTARAIPVANTPGANSVAVAEHAMMMMLALAKDAIGHDRAVREGRWNHRRSNTPFELANKTLLVIGFGRSGQELALRARAFGMRVAAAGRSVDPVRAAELGVEPVMDWKAVLGRVDVVSIHIPRPPGPGYLIGRTELMAMRPGALLVNCARGGIVDEAALAVALAEGRVGGAGLDVLEDEPPQRASPLLGLPNVILSPHVAGNTDEAAQRMACAAARNVRAAFEGGLDPAAIVNRRALAVHP